MVPLVKHPTNKFGSGDDLIGHEIKPCSESVLVSELNMESA